MTGAAGGLFYRKTVERQVGSRQFTFCSVSAGSQCSGLCSSGPGDVDKLIDNLKGKEVGSSCESAV